MKYKDPWVPIISTNTKRELIKRIKHEPSLKGIKVHVKDILKNTKYKDYWKMRIKGGLEKRFTASVKPDYWSN